MLINIIMTILAIGFFILFFVSYPLAGLVIAKHFDKHFPEFAQSKSSFPNGYWIFSNCLRGFMYIGMIMFKNYAEKSLIRGYQNALFKGFSFRNNARPIDWFVIWLTLGALFLATTASAALFIVQNF